MTSPWLNHVKDIKGKNSDKGLKEVLDIASKSFQTGGGDDCASPLDAKPEPPQGHIYNKDVFDASSEPLGAPLKEGPYAPVVNQSNNEIASLKNYHPGAILEKPSSILGEQYGGKRKSKTRKSKRKKVKRKSKRRKVKRKSKRKKVKRKS